MKRMIPGPLQPGLAQWYYRLPWTRVLMFSYCISCAFVGVLGLLDKASPAMSGLLGPFGVYVYSGLLLVSGLIGAAGIFRSLRATVISVWTIAVGTFFHGLAAMTTPGGLQTGLRLAVAPLMMVPLVWTWWQWLTLVLQVRDGDGWHHVGWRRNREG